MSKRVLIVEDDKSIARLLRDNLEYEGFTVRWSETGADALQIAREFSPDLVLLDLMLPNNFDGLELCRAFANGRERIPVIILTARGQKIDKLRVQTVEKGLSVVPLRLYFKGSRVKAEIAVVRGKKQYDKRETEKTREADRELAQAMKQSR